MRHRLLIIAGVLTLTGAFAGYNRAPSSAFAQATPTVPSGGEQYTPIVQAVHSTPRWFVGTDGLTHLTYELLLTNMFPIAVTVTSVEVLDAETGDVLQRLDGEALLALMTLAATPTVPSVEVPPSAIGAVWVDVPVESEGELPSTVEHRLTVQVPPGLPLPESLSYTGAMADVDLRAPVVLGAPLAGPGWVAIGSCCDGPHRRSLQPINGEVYLSQRFAIDFNKLDDQNRLSSGDPSLNTSYPTYGEPVLAVADATVVAAVDQYPDQVPFTTEGVTLENADGNHVILDLGDGRYAFYAHLLPGSVSVQVGDRVERGQQIGEAGNSGSSDGPHLHFHVMDAPSALVADGIPYVFDTFTFTGAIPPLADALPYFEAQEPMPINTDGAGARRDQLPLGSSVVTFAPESPAD